MKRNKLFDPYCITYKNGVIMVQNRNYDVLFVRSRNNTRGFSIKRLANLANGAQPPLVCEDGVNLFMYYDDPYSQQDLDKRVRSLTRMLERYFKHETLEWQVNEQKKLLPSWRELTN